MLEKRLPADPQIRRLLENAQQGAQRGAALTQRMLAFARRQDLKHEQVNVTELTRGMTELLERTLGASWPLKIELPENLPRVLADANQLEMAILNLVVNARDATPGGGPIRISATTAQIDIDDRGDLPAGEYICVRVIDRGEGMDTQTLRRATEPFFTTKGVGKGTGLGLSMVDGLAKQLNGAFELQSAPGHGTTACLWLPAMNGPTEQSKPMLPQMRISPARALKVLTVDDDFLIRMNISAMLEEMGHVVVDAASGDVALELVRQDPDIELLITDQAMPAMTGTQLIEQVKVLRPDLPVILATGYGELPTGAPWKIQKLGKPFNEEQLASAVAHVMASATDCSN
jgi:CheY-like chemotaxis protein